MKRLSLVHRGELLVSLGLLVLGVYIVYHAGGIAESQGYEQLGPRLFPALIGAGLALFGVALTWHVLTGGWRNMPQDQEAHKLPDWKAFLFLSAGVIVQMTLVKSIGFTFATTLLFFAVTYGFGSRRLVRDALIGLSISVFSFYLFTLVLKLHLPASPLGVI
jgi:putative tricarboxylic transport membrane protein